MRLILAILLFLAGAAFSRIYNKRRFDRSVRYDLETSDTDDLLERKQWIFTDYETHFRAYKDRQENSCYVEKLEEGAIPEEFSENGIEERISKTLYAPNEFLTKLEAWRIAGGRVVDFCNGRKIILLQRTVPIYAETIDPYFNILPIDENDIVPRRVADVVLTPLISRAKRQIVLEEREKLNANAKQNRLRRQVQQPPGRFRGQTQSQYLNIGNNDKKEGKAEAEATQQSSRAVVSGSNGMGQAQSMSLGSIGCEGCPGYDGAGPPGRYVQVATVPGIKQPGEAPPSNIITTGVGPTYPSRIPGRIPSGEVQYPTGNGRVFPKIPGDATYPGVTTGGITYPGGTPGTTGGRVIYPGVVPGTVPGGVLGTVPGAVPGTVPGGVPGTIPGAVPGTVPGGVPRTIPGAVPGIVPDVVPGTVPGAVPGTVPGTIPRVIPGTVPGTRPGAVPGAIPDGRVSYPGGTTGTIVGGVYYPGGGPDSSVTYPGGVAAPGDTSYPGSIPSGIPSIAVGGGDVTYPGGVPGTVHYPERIPGIDGGTTYPGATYPGGAPGTIYQTRPAVVPGTGDSQTVPQTGAKVYPGAQIPTSPYVGPSYPGRGGEIGGPGTLTGTTTADGRSVYQGGLPPTGQTVHYPGKVIPGGQVSTGGGVTYPGGTVPSGTGYIPEDGRYPTGPIGPEGYLPGSTGIQIRPGDVQKPGADQTGVPYPPLISYPEGGVIQRPEGGKYPDRQTVIPGYGLPGQYPDTSTWTDRGGQQYPTDGRGIGRYPGLQYVPGTGEVPQYYQKPGAPLPAEDDNANSQASSSVKQTDSGTQASASAQGKFGQGTAQSQVAGTYSGSGSFSAQAGSIDNDKSAQTEINGGKDGATSNAQGVGGRGKSQAQVQLNSESGATSTGAQSSGWNHGTNSQVQASAKGGMADAQANGEGSTSSQAQIGFQPYLKTDEKVKENVRPFRGGGTASAQSGTYTGQSQSQLEGSFQYGINYSGAAQAGSGSGAAASRKPFNFSLTDPDLFKSFKPSNTPEVMNASLETIEHGLQTSSTSRRKVVARPADEKTEADDDGYDYADEYEDDYDNVQDESSMKPKIAKIYVAEQNDSDHQSQMIRVATGGNYDVHIKQDRNAQAGDMLQPGQSSSGYTIPAGFRGRVTSVAGGETVAQGSGKSQSQTVSLVPKRPSAIYENKSPISDMRSLKTNHERLAEGRASAKEAQKDNSQLKIQQASTASMKPAGYYTVTNSVAGKMDDKNSPRKYEHRYYTKSSTCGYFTFSCNVVYGSNGRTKICKPRMPTHPDGTPMKC